MYIIGQLVGQYKIGYNKKPIVLITDFKALYLSGNTNRVSSKSITIPKAISSTNQKYRPKLTKFFILLVTTKRSRLSSSSFIFDRLDIRDSKSPNVASSLISR